MKAHQEIHVQRYMLPDLNKSNKEECAIYFVKWILLEYVQIPVVYFYDKDSVFKYIGGLTIFKRSTTGNRVINHMIFF